MAYGEADADDPAEEPTGRRPLPRADRVWRHPAEVAMDARRLAARRRSQRCRRSATVLGVVATAAGLLWLSQEVPTGATFRGDVESPDSAVDTTATPIDESSTTLVDAPLDAPPSTAAETDLLTIRLPGRAETLAGALVLRDGFVLTSGRALAGAQRVIVAWGSHSAIGTVVGYDEVTDVAVISVDAPTPDGGTASARGVTAGDTVLLADPEEIAGAQQVVDPTSASARIDGEPVIGIMELDGRLGAVPAGSPAFDQGGAIIGIVTSTASDAPAAIVPIELVRAVAGEIIDLGAATHPRLGVRARTPSGDDPDVAGSLITDVAAGGPAAVGGVEVGDLIVEIEDTPIRSMESMVATLRLHEPGDAVQVVVVRGGESVSCAVELGSQIDQAA